MKISIEEVVSLLTYFVASLIFAVLVRICCGIPMDAAFIMGVIAVIIGTVAKGV